MIADATMTAAENPAAAAATNTRGTLYLVPVTLGGEDLHHSLPNGTLDALISSDEFIVEEEKSARRFMKQVNPDAVISSLIFHTLNEHSRPDDYRDYLSCCERGGTMSLVSEAGLPCVADPGALIVRLAHAKGIRVIPLSGPSSITLSLMASGLNGQQFEFHGYLPAEKQARRKKIIELEKKAHATGATQIFIETPYRNDAVREDIISVLKNETMLCIAAELMSQNELIVSKPAAQWKKDTTVIGKRPAIFLIGR